MSDEFPRTTRGFRIFDAFQDRSGRQVTVQESSLATERACWIFLGPGEVGDAAHLTVDQATRLMHALEAFVGDYSRPPAGREVWSHDD